MYRSGDLSFGQTLMAANSPMMIQEAMVKGNPEDGILPSGQVAGLIDDLPTVADLVASIVSDAETAASSIQTTVCSPQIQNKDWFMAFNSTVDAGIAEVIFNKPPVNAFNSAEWAGIAAEIKALAPERRSRHYRSRRGQGLCAGVDIKELGADPNMIVPVNKGNYDTFEAIHRNPKPVIVALHGFVLGGGIGIAGAADIIVASECASFGVPEVDRGAMGGGATYSACSPFKRSATCTLRASLLMPTRLIDWARWSVWCRETSSWRQHDP